jgi:hypothetical protein
MIDDQEANEKRVRQTWHRSLRWASMGLAIGLLATAIWALTSSTDSPKSRQEDGVAPSASGEVRTLSGETTVAAVSGKESSPRGQALQSIAMARLQFENFDAAMTVVRAMEDPTDRDQAVLILADFILPLEKSQKITWRQHPYDESISANDRTELLGELGDVLQLSKLASEGAIKAELMLRVACTKMALDKRKENAPGASNEPPELAGVDSKKLMEEAERIARSLSPRASRFQFTWGLVFSTALAALSYICSQIGGPIVAVLGKLAAKRTAQQFGANTVATQLNEDLQRTTGTSKP